MVGPDNGLDDDWAVSLDDWRGERLAQTWKWLGSPVWEHNGIVAVGNAHKGEVKLTFPCGTGQGA